jgi:hypothetical protein
MQQDIINKYGKEVVQNFWIFVENLKFDAKRQDASNIRASILKKISPSVAEKYKELCDELAFSLYRNVYYDKKNLYLYAAFEAVSKGGDFYNKCWIEPLKIETLIEGIDQFNNFSAVLPIEDDYFAINLPTPQEVWEDYEEYDETLEASGNKRAKKKQKDDKYED